MKQIFSLLFGSKVKAIIFGVIFVAISTQISVWIFKYKRAIKDVVTIQKDLDDTTISLNSEKALNASLLLKKDSLEQVVIARDNRVKEIQGLLFQQRGILKGKESYIKELQGGVMCKVPQKVKKGFLRYEWELKIVNCDSLLKTL